MQPRTVASVAVVEGSGDDAFTEMLAKARFRPADRLAVEERVTRLGEQLLPLVDRANRMMIRNLKAIKELRQGQVRERWDILTFDPGVTEIEGPLEVKPTKIRAALGQGCVKAAAAIHTRLRLESTGSVSSDESQKYAEAVCQPLIRSRE